MFYNLPTGAHEFNAYFKGFRSCGPVAIDVNGAGRPAGTITLRPIPGQGWVNQYGDPVTPRPDDLAAEAAEQALPCPEVPKR